VGAPLAYFYLHEDILDVTVMTVSRGHVEETVASISAGTVVAEQDSMIAAGLLGTIAAVPDEGRRVTKGDLLVELDHAEMDAHVALTEANLRVGLSRLEQVKLAAKIYSEITATRVSLTSAQLELAESEYERIKSLADKKAVSQSDFDKIAAALRVAQETHAAAKSAQKENQIREEEVRMAETAMEQLEQAAVAARAARERALVKAPFDGVVARRLQDVGEATTMGVPLLQLVNDTDKYIEAPFDEANVADIKIGQKVRLNTDAYRDRDFAGEVYYISPIIASNVGMGADLAAAAAAATLSRTLNVKIHILEGQELFLPGMSVDVTVIVDEKEDVPSVPTEVLVREEYAYVIGNGRAVRQSVTTGIGNWQAVEVLDGIKEGDTIITSVSLKELKDGVKVRVVDRLED